MTEQPTYGIRLDELMEICRLLDRIIKQEEKQEAFSIDRTIGKVLTDIDVWAAAATGSELMRLQSLRDRLFNLIPQEYL